MDAMITVEEKSTEANGSGTSHFVSELPEGPQRFLSQVVEHSLQSGRRTAKDFVRHFPPAAIMAGLTDHPQLRANILVPTTGTRDKIAIKKSAESAGEDLQIALDEGVTDEGQIASLFLPDDRVRYLDHQKLWSFLVEGEFWKAKGAKQADVQTARMHLAFMIDCARKNKLLSDQDIVDGCTLDKIVERLPKTELCKLLTAALSDGRDGRPFKDDRFLDVTSAEVLLEHVPLSHIWDMVLVPKIAVIQGYVNKPQEAPPPPEPDLPEPDSSQPTAIADVSALADAPEGSPSRPRTPSGSRDLRPPPPPISSGGKSSPGDELPAPKAPPQKGAKTRGKRLGSVDLSEFEDELDRLLGEDDQDL
jgi:hypothetical protein